MRTRTRIHTVMATLTASVVLASCTSTGQADPTTITVSRTAGSSAGPASSTAGSTSSDGPGSSSPSAPATTSASKPSSGKPPTSNPATSPSSSQPSSSAPSSAPTDGRPASNVPMRKLKAGEKAPQFVIFSFDGAGSHDKWQEFMAAAEPTNSRFVGFLTGIYLLASANKEKYQGPGHAAGKASIGFGGEKDEIITEINDLNQAYAAGHEIGTHYNGHFCSDNPPSGTTWSTADWESELGQFMKFLTDYKELNGWGDEVPDLKVTPADIKGGRTPCLEGELAAMAPAWKKFDLTYDSSLSTKSGISWPVKMQGIWEFEMPYIYSPGFDKMILAMDYNFMCEVAACDQTKDVGAATRPKVRATYDFMYEQAYNGSRAPVLIANHFNVWNGDAYNKPALEFMQDTCGKKDTYCATYQDVIAWMELQDPAVLAKLQGLPAVAAAAG